MPPGRGANLKRALYQKVSVAQISVKQRPPHSQRPLAPASGPATRARPGTAAARREVMKKGRGVRSANHVTVKQGLRSGRHTGCLALPGKGPWNSRTANSNLYHVARSVGQESGPGLRAAAKQPRGPSRSAECPGDRAADSSQERSQRESKKKS